MSAAIRAYIPDDRLLTTGEVAAIWRISTRQVMRWDAEGRFPDGCVVRTPGGRRRFRESVILTLLQPDGGES